jgi:hypothetical protein
MKRLIVGGLSLAWLFAPTGSHARWESDSTMLTMNLGYATAKSRLTDEQLHGGSIGAALDFVIPDEVVSFGITIVASSADDESSTSSGTEARAYNSTAYYGTFKVWFGSERVKGYGGLGAGFHNTRVESSIGSSYDLATESGFAIGIPLGAVFFTGEKVFLNANGLINIMGQSVYQNNVTYVIGAGLGFKL